MVECSSVNEEGIKMTGNKIKYLDESNYESLDIDDKIIRRLRNLSHHLRFHEGKGSQNRILIILYKHGEMTQKDLTEKIGIQPGSASEVIKKLESSGFIERTISCKDHRTTDIKLTDAGRLTAMDAIKKREKHHHEMFASLSSIEKTNLLFLLEKLNDNWDKAYFAKEKNNYYLDNSKKIKKES